MTTATVQNGKVRIGDTVTSRYRPEQGRMTVQGFSRAKGNVLLKVIDKNPPHGFIYVRANNCEKVV